MIVTWQGPEGALAVRNSDLSFRVRDGIIEEVEATGPVVVLDPATGREIQLMAEATIKAAASHVTTEAGQPAKKVLSGVCACGRAVSFWEGAQESKCPYCARTLTLKEE